MAFDLSGTRTPVTEGPADPEPIQGSSSVAAHRGVFVDSSDLGSNTAYVSDTATGRALGQLVDDLGSRTDHWADGAQHQAEVVAMTPDGSTAVVGILGYLPSGWLTDHGALVIFDALTRQQRAVVELPWPAYGIAVTPDGRRAVVNGAKGYAVVDLAQARLVGEPVSLEEIPRQAGANGAEASPDGRWVALARDGEVVLVDLSTGKVAPARRGRRAGRCRRPDPGLVGGLHDPGPGDDQGLAARAVGRRPHRRRAATAHHRWRGQGPGDEPRRTIARQHGRGRATSCCGTRARGDPTDSRSRKIGHLGGSPSRRTAERCASSSRTTTSCRSRRPRVTG